MLKIWSFQTSPRWIPPCHITLRTYDGFCNLIHINNSFAFNFILTSKNKSEGLLFYQASSISLSDMWKTLIVRLLKDTIYYVN